MSNFQLSYEINKEMKELRSENEASEIFNVEHKMLPYDPIITEDEVI